MSMDDPSFALIKESQSAMIHEMELMTRENASLKMALAECEAKNEELYRDAKAIRAVRR